MLWWRHNIDETVESSLWLGGVDNSVSINQSINQTSCIIHIFEITWQYTAGLYNTIRRTIFTLQMHGCISSELWNSNLIKISLLHLLLSLPLPPHSLSLSLSLFLNRDITLRTPLLPLSFVSLLRLVGLFTTRCVFKWLATGLTYFIYNVYAKYILTYTLYSLTYLLTYLLI